VPFSPAHDTPSELLRVALTKLTQWTLAVLRMGIKLFLSLTEGRRAFGPRPKENIYISSFLEEIKKINVHV